MSDDLGSIVKQYFDRRLLLSATAEVALDRHLPLPRYRQATWWERLHHIIRHRRWLDRVFVGWYVNGVYVGMMHPGWPPAKKIEWRRYGER